ncbi:lysozyme g-like isoform X2 [Sceloporus undulatus]|uniref:lysozyme g-like isoform X2 n=1 Tax=Sceloporus undulatus TaxID=8520 RepID=UPI001C4CBBBB|nr:lysozyme g-like isoform X2 [Sceloporus undulatus]
MGDQYGNIMRVDTTGASLETGKQEGLSYGGIAASEKIAERDLKNLEKYKTTIQNVSEKTGIDAALIAAIMSRESHAGTILKNGWGDHGNGFGLMQVDKRYHKPTGTWDSEEHITQATLILATMIKEIQKKFPQWTKEQQLKGGIAAYNAGTKNVQTYERLDVGTTKNDYANDVVARTVFYKKMDTNYNLK